MKKLLFIVFGFNIFQPLSTQAQDLLIRAGFKAKQMLEKKAGNKLDSAIDRKAPSKTQKKGRQQADSTGVGDIDRSDSITVAKNNSFINQQDTSFSYSMGDIPASEAEAKKILCSGAWDLQWKHPIYCIYKPGGVFLQCPSMEPLFCTDPLKWELEWSGKKITVSSTNPQGVVRIIKKLTRNEMVLWDVEYKVELTFKPYQKGVAR